ncbi:MAG: RDD family protein [Trichodesmium sp. MO_231.B1]|nr:RDD family protein [Trichodesmium sp. MO_231.B1]
MVLLGTIIFNDYSIYFFISLIDWVSLYITTGIFGIILNSYFFGGFFIPLLFESIKFLTFILFITILKWFYFTRLESLPIKTTFWKKIMGIVVTDLNENTISFGRANRRYFAKKISLITLLIGFIMAAFTKKNQGLHDMIAATLVVKKKP